MIKLNIIKVFRLPIKNHFNKIVNLVNKIVNKTNALNSPIGLHHAT